MEEPNIPQGYRLVASTPLRIAEASVYYSPLDLRFIIVIDNTIQIDDLTKERLEALHHVLEDVIAMKSRYVFLS